MGYYTTYNLEVVSGNDGVTDYEKEITELSGYQYLFGDHVKWYNHEDDMRHYSAKHSNTLFMLRGEGEEPGDLWCAYFLNGKMQMTLAKITYEDFDETKLK